MNNESKSLKLASQIKSFPQKKSNLITNSTLILFAFATAFFSRIIDSLGAPAIINFFHFSTIPVVFYLVLCTSRSQNRERLQTISLLLGGLFFLLINIIASAFLNNAGFINVLLDFMLLGEPFILLISIICIPLSPESFTKFRKWLLSFFWIHLLLVFIQKYILKTDTWNWVGMEGADRIQGVFFISGSGHVVGCSVSLTFALYYLLQARKSPLWLRILVFIAAIWNIIIADGKQVIFAFMLAMILLFLIKLNDIVAALKYIISGAILGAIFWWCIKNLQAFSAFNTWIRPELYGPDGEATLLKLASFRIIPTHYDSILNWFFGLGPGHTVGRLGGWMLPKYANLLAPLGSTTHTVSKEVWQAVGASWLGSKSSMFSPLFGWAGIWGDLGLLGLGAYLFLAFVVWQRVCKNDLMQFLLLTVFIFGCIFSQLEEPGYMLTIASLIGLQYQKYLINKNQKINPYKL